jgi:hypothetical protein
MLRAMKENALQGYRLALDGDGDRGPLGIKSITAYFNDRDIRTRDGGSCGIASVHQILMRTTYIGQHRLNTRATRRERPSGSRARRYGCSTDHHRQALALSHDRFDGGVGRFGGEAGLKIRS